MEEPAPYATYLEDIDILYVRLSDTEIARSGNLDLWRNIDLAADGSLVAVEFVKASAGINLDNVPQPEEVERLIRRFNLPVAV